MEDMTKLINSKAWENNTKRMENKIQAESDRVNAILKTMASGFGATVKTIGNLGK